MIDGYKVEDLFIEAAPKEWLFLRKANANEDMNEHWDVKFLIDGIETLIDVKAHKAEYRNGPLLKDWFWVEFVNVRGNTGWVHGKADYIAFEYNDEFLVYNRVGIAATCLMIVDLDTVVDKASKACNVGYRRFGRKDLISKIKISDLAKPKYIISK